VKIWPHFFHRLYFRHGVSRNKFLRRTFEPEKDEVTGVLRRLHNKELYFVYSSRNIIRAIKPRRMEWAGHVARMEERRGACRVLVRKSEGVGHLKQPGLEGRIILKTGLGEVVGGDMDWTKLAQDADRWLALVNVVMNLRTPKNAKDVLT
jgi:hypothetical protein